jgi:hypothetical protein
MSLYWYQASEIVKYILPVYAAVNESLKADILPRGPRLGGPKKTPSF